MKLTKTKLKQIIKEELETMETSDVKYPKVKEMLDSIEPGLYDRAMGALKDKQAQEQQNWEMSGNFSGRPKSDELFLQVLEELELENLKKGEGVQENAKLDDILTNMVNKFASGPHPLPRKEAIDAVLKVIKTKLDLMLRQENY